MNTSQTAVRPTGWVAGLGVLVAFALVLRGFWPSFYAHPAALDVPRLVHGVIATVWMLILLVQPWLVVMRQYALHRLVGRASIAWAIILMVATLYLQHVLYAEPLNGPDPLPFRVGVGFVNLTTLVLFAGLYVRGLQCAFARKIEAHSRYMACTLAVPVIPAIARIFGGAPGIPIAFGFIGLVLLLALLVDFVRLRKVYAAPLLTLLFLAVVFVLAPQAGHLAPYMAIARAMGYPG